MIHVFGTLRPFILTSYGNGQEKCLLFVSKREGTQELEIYPCEVKELCCFPLL